MSQRDVIFQCRIVGAELRGTNSDMKIGGGLRRNRGGVQRGGVRPPGLKDDSFLAKVFIANFYIFYRHVESKRGTSMHFETGSSL